MQPAMKKERPGSAGQSHECVTHRLLPLYVPQGRYPLGQGGGRDGEENCVFCAMFQPALPHPHPNPPLEGEGVARHPIALARSARS
jgi:hypothetical protein